MKFARWTFTLGSIWGVLVLVPLYFMEASNARADPPALTHPEYYYGFLGVALVWQAAYFLCGRDPVRYRPLMLLCAAAKTSWVITLVTLFALHRCSTTILSAAVPDGLLAALFVIAFAKTPGTLGAPVASGSLSAHEDRG